MISYVARCALGELWHMWDHGLVENRLCGRGERFREWLLWQRVLAEAYGGVNRVDPIEMIALREHNARTRHIPLMPVPEGRQVLRPRLRRYLDSLDRLYRAVRSTTGCEAIVDSSKYPAYSYVLSMVSSIDLYVVHLVRDPGGAAFSWSRRKLEPSVSPPVYMRRIGPVTGSVLWAIWNTATEALWGRVPERYMLLRYEEAMERPPEAVRRILDLVEEEVPHLPFVSDRQVRLTQNHTTSGNPSRFRSGAVELRTDPEWEIRMSRAHKLLATSLTWPLLPRYGYPLRA